MRRKIGLFKEYDIVEFTEDQPDRNYLVGESRVIVSISESRNRSSAEFCIERDNAVDAIIETIRSIRETAIAK